MKICIWLKNTDPNHTTGDPGVIRRWDRWPCVPRIGEKYLWLDDVDLFDELFLVEDDKIFRVADVVHERVPRNFWERLCGRPREVVMIVFEIDDVTILKQLLEEDPFWERKEDVF